MKLTFPEFDAALVEEIEAFLDQPYQTEITNTAEHPDLGITYTRARGFTPTGRPGTRGVDQYARPMFQLIQDRAFSGSGPRGTLCQCGDFAYSWNCPEHDELPWDSKARRWIRPAAEDGVNTDGIVFRGIQDAFNNHPIVDADALARLLDSMQAGAAECQRRLASLPPATISIRYTAEPEDGSAVTADRVVHVQIETEGGEPRGR